LAAAVIGLTVLFGRSERVASSAMADQSLSEQARAAVLKSIIKSAPTVGNSPAGIRDLAEGHALLERELVPNAGVVTPGVERVASARTTRDDLSDRPRSGPPPPLL
jgi:hypothetical protein